MPHTLVLADSHILPVRLHHCIGVTHRHGISVTNNLGAPKVKPKRSPAALISMAGDDPAWLHSQWAWWPSHHSSNSLEPSSNTSIFMAQTWAALGLDLKVKYLTGLPGNGRHNPMCCCVKSRLLQVPSQVTVMSMTSVDLAPCRRWRCAEAAKILLAATP